MLRTGCAVLCLLLFLPAVTQGQEWTDAQREIWEWEISCWEVDTLDGYMACLHTDFVGWGLGSPLPTKKVDRGPSADRDFKINEQVFLDLQPVAINIKGDMAVLVYLATYVDRNKVTGEETEYVEKWTDVCLKEDGRWTWIADHGTTIEEG